MIKCKYIKWSNVNISNANISNANILSVNISNANISNANILSVNISNANIFTFDHLIYLHLIIWYIYIWSFDISAFDIFPPQIHFYIIPKNPQMCPAHRDLPTPSHPHSQLNLPHPIPSHTYNGLKTFSLSTTPSGRSPPSAQTFVPSTVAYRHKSTKLPSSTTKHS